MSCVHFANTCYTRKSKTYFTFERNIYTTSSLAVFLFPMCIYFTVDWYPRRYSITANSKQVRYYSQRDAKWEFSSNKNLMRIFQILIRAGELKKILRKNVFLTSRTDTTMDRYLCVSAIHLWMASPRYCSAQWFALYPLFPWKNKKKKNLTDIHIHTEN